MFGRGRAHPGELPLSAIAGLPSDATELARLWITSDRSFVAVGRPAQWPPELLGSLLVECVRNAAATYSAAGVPEGEALQRLWRGFDDERARLESPNSSEEFH